MQAHERIAATHLINLRAEKFQRTAFGLCKQEKLCKHGASDERGQAETQPSMKLQQTNAQMLTAGLRVLYPKLKRY